MISIVLVDPAGAVSLHHPSREGCEVQNLNLGPRESRVEDAARASLLSDSCGDAVKVPIEGDHRIRPPVPHDRDRRPIREAQRPAAGTAKHFQSAEERLLPDELEGNPRGARIGGHDEVEGTDRCRVTTCAGEHDRDDLVQDEVRGEGLPCSPSRSCSTSASARSRFLSRSLNDAARTLVSTTTVSPAPRTGSGRSPPHE